MGSLADGLRVFNNIPASLTGSLAEAFTDSKGHSGFTKMGFVDSKGHSGFTRPPSFLHFPCTRRFLSKNVSNKTAFPNRFHITT